MTTTEIEVYKYPPQPDTCYATAEYTRTSNKGNTTYFTTNLLKYLGRYTVGYNNYDDTYNTTTKSGTLSYAFYDETNDKTNILKYEGKTCLVEVNCNELVGGKLHKSKTFKRKPNKKTRTTKRRKLTNPPAIGFAG